MKSCAHVVCKTCTDSLVRPAKQCVVCDIVVNNEDIIELKREGTLQKRTWIRRLTNLAVGTGFAGGGMAETTKKGVVFQG
jgi:nitric oxide synthase-interacting protein